MNKLLHEMTDAELAKAFAEVAEELGFRGRNACETAFTEVDTDSKTGNTEEFLEQMYEWLETNGENQ